MNRPIDFAAEQALETYRSMISIGTESLKALQLINGGAIVAILAYLGQAANGATVAREVSRPLGFFVAGLVVATVAFLTTYLTQHRLLHDLLDSEAEGRSRHTFWLVVTVVLALASVALFAWGARGAVAALGHS